MYLDLDRPTSIEPLNRILSEIKSNCQDPDEKLSPELTESELELASERRRRLTELNETHKINASDNFQLLSPRTSDPSPSQGTLLNDEDESRFEIDTNGNDNYRRRSSHTNYSVDSPRQMLHRRISHSNRLSKSDLEY